MVLVVVVVVGGWVGGIGIDIFVVYMYALCVSGAVNTQGFVWKVLCAMYTFSIMSHSFTTVIIIICFHKPFKLMCNDINHMNYAELIPLLQLTVLQQTDSDKVGLWSSL